MKIARTPHLCDACGSVLPPDAVYHRFHVVLEAEADLPWPPRDDAETSPQALLARMEEEGAWERYEAEVHWEARGEICPDCRERLRQWLTGRERPTGTR